MKAIVLTRVSDEKQDSNEAQEERLQNYIQIKRFSPVVIYKIKESSTKADRKEFSKIIEEIQKSKEPIAFIVDTVDRMQRSFKESVILDDLRKNGKVELHFYRENLVIHKDSNSSDIMRWDMSVMFAKSYVLQLSDNVKRKREYLVNNGYLTGKAPYGYDNVTLSDDKKDVIINDYESKIVIKMYELYSTGAHSLLTLRNKLKEDYNINFSNGYVDVILKNPFYYGEMLTKGKLYPHRYTPIISRELYDKVQDVKAGFNKKHYKFAGLPYIYRGLIRCALCGCMVTPEKSKKKYVYYHCTNYHKVHPKSELEWLSEDDLTKQFAQLYKRLRIPENVLIEITEALRTVHKGKSDFRENLFQELTQEKNRNAKRIENMYMDKLDGRITADEYDNLYKEFKSRIDETDRKLFNLQKAEDDYYITSNYLLQLANRAYDLFISSEMEQKRQLVKLTLQNLTLNGRKVEYEAIKPFDTILNYADNKLWLPD